ncbi:hypothetical protein [Sporolactobacillus laevolacticus]|uniref:hypothetical protein n=1 Tax=Sporolactobacillus laevolacticus TaxID=33018 RepID=UPI0025B4B51D|nr:hypothetical protein [Sporolactobacillus laevolacticus]MDN3956199.1 hypothetical protein [Sporolactobacillus laevolacticus]
MNQNPIWLIVLPVIISSGVSVIIFMALNFFIEPRKEKREMLEKRLHMLYAPAYGVIIAGVELICKDFPDRMMIGSYGEHLFLTRRKIEEIVYNNISYASTNLIEVWSKYVASRGAVEKDISVNIIMTVVSEYNAIRKKLKLPFNEAELRTGIPESYAHLRK